MNASYIQLSTSGLITATVLILVCGAVSLALQLRMERTLLLASLRTVLQLLLIGMVLRYVFAAERWYLVTGLGLIMTLVAGVAAVRRNERRFPGIWLSTLVSVGASSWLVAGYGLLGVLRDVDPWYRPQYAIPLLGMLLGNSLNGISLGLSSLSEALVARRGEIDGLLALGATRYEAAGGVVRHAVRTGMIPIVNSMMVVGIVSLPGMMTGQLLSGVAPMEAVKYQIAIMFLIAATTALGTVGSVLLAHRCLFNESHQFRYDQITRKKPPQ